MVARKSRSRIKSRAGSRSRPVSKSRSVSSSVSRSKPVPLYTKRSASWFRNIPEPRQRRGTESYFKIGLKNARKMFRGFDAKHGFDLRRVDHWPVKRMREAQKWIRFFNTYTSRPDQYQLVRPRTKAEEAALYRYTTEAFPELHRHAQRSYIVHMSAPALTRVEYVPAPVQTGWKVETVRAFGRTVRVRVPVYEDGLRVELQRQVKGGQVTERNYIFQEILGWQPGLEVEPTIAGAKLLGIPVDPWEQMVFALKELIDHILPALSPSGQEPSYSLLTHTHGPIGQPVPLSGLLEEARRYSRTYGVNRETGERDPSFADTIIGVRYMGTEFQATQKAVKIERQRAKYIALKKAFRLARMRKFRRLSRSYRSHRPARVFKRKRSSKSVRKVKQKRKFARRAPRPRRGK